MPRRLVLTGSYQAEFMTYEDTPLTARQVRVQTELASGKIGTTTASSTAAPFMARASTRRCAFFETLKQHPEQVIKYTVRF